MKKTEKKSIKKAKENKEEESPKCLGPVRDKLFSVTQYSKINFKMS